jgi:S-formylglutathione hydrolase FrmB
MICALMQRKAIVFSFLLLLNSVVALSQMGSRAPVSGASRSARIQESTFHSASLNRDMHYLVLFPSDYASGRRFPVLYLLHGLYGDYKNWDTKTHLESAAASVPLLIVTPDADDSWYTDSGAKAEDKFEDYIAKDLISEVDSKYRTIREKRARAIAGLSMGGYGAVKLSLKYPELFAFAGSLSGAFDAAQNLDDLRPEFRAKLLEVFGNPGSKTRTENDVFLLLKSSSSTPYFYLACGADDFFLDTNRAFAAQLSNRKITYEYHETPGGHTWEYWDSQLTPLLQAVERSLRPGSTSK